MSKTFNDQPSIAKVISLGGWTFYEPPYDLVTGMERVVLEAARQVFNTTISDSDRLIEILASGSEQEYSSIFDAVSMDTYLGYAQHMLNKFVLKGEFEHPLMWTYPNFRIDVPKRRQYSSPPHCDEWISFRGGKSLVFWTPLFEDGYLDISCFRGKIELEEHSYWGLSVSRKQDIKWETILIPRGQFLIFRSDLLHKSSERWGPSNLRTSMQFRYEDYAAVPKPFVRAVTQKLAASIVDSQKRAVSDGFSN